MGFKINAGSGTNKLDGYLNVDMSAACEPDFVHDLTSFPWRMPGDGPIPPPIPNSAVEEVRFEHSLEHMGEMTGTFRGLIQELYRVCQDGALVHIRVPHYRHDDFFSDPTHVRVITIPMMHLLSKKACAEFRKMKAANTQLADYWDVDFELVSSNLALDERFSHWINTNGQPDPGLERTMLTQNNVVKEIHITLKVVKPKQGEPES